MKIFQKEPVTLGQPVVINFSADHFGVLMHWICGRNAVAATRFAWGLLGG